jgi:hypothetical protein
MKKTIIISIFLIISLFSSYCIAEIRVVNFEHEFKNDEIGDYVTEYDDGLAGILYTHLKKFPILELTPNNIQIVQTFGMDWRLRYLGIPETTSWGTWVKINLPFFIDNGAIWVAFRYVYNNWMAPSIEDEMWITGGKFRMVVMYDDTK